MDAACQQSWRVNGLKRCLLATVRMPERELITSSLASTEGYPDCKFTPSGCGANQRKVGYVHASDQEHHTLDFQPDCRLRIWKRPLDARLAGARLFHAVAVYRL